MKKKIAIILIILILFVPIPGGPYKDGGTKTYTALTYKVVVWNRLDEAESVVHKTSIHFFPDNFKSIDELWELEKPLQIDESDLPGMFVDNNELFCLVLHQPDDLEKNSEDFVFWTKIASPNDPDVALGDAYKFGDDVVVFLHYNQQYYLYKPFDQCGQFSTGENLSDEQYQELMDEGGSIWSERLKTFLLKLRETDEFAFFSIVDQPIYIYDKEFPEEFLDGYEDPTWDHLEHSLFSLDGRDMAFVKAIQVSEKFFSEYDIRPTAGESFEVEDYNYDLETNMVPVLMGSEYTKYYKVGDSLTGEFLTDDTTYIVKGFFEKGTKYWDGNVFKSLDRLMVLPAFITEDSLPFAKPHLLQQAQGMIITDKTFDEVQTIYEGFLADAGLAEWDINVFKPNPYFS